MIVDNNRAEARTAKNLIIWGLFALASLATVLTYNVLWLETNYFTWLPWLGFGSLILGIIVLIFTSLNRWSVTIVVLGLLVGQWWYVKSLIVLVFMACCGFAP
jgi:hypothetical protein